jgi:hypothetical protein
MSIIESNGSFSTPYTQMDAQSLTNNDDNDGMTDDQAALSQSFNDSLSTFTSTLNNDDGNDDNNDANSVNDEEPMASIDDTSFQSRSTTTRSPLTRQKTLPTSSMFDSFDSELKRAYHRLEPILSKLSIEQKQFDAMQTSIDSQLADIRLMIESEQHCSLMDDSIRYSSSSINDRLINRIWQECDLCIIKLVFEQYLNSHTILSVNMDKSKSVVFYSM